MVSQNQMTHEYLKRPSIDSTGRQSVSRSMAQHVSVDLEWQICGLAKPFNQLLGAVDGKRRLTLRQEHEIRMGTKP